MSFLTAVLGGFGGYEKGRRERDQYDLQKQQVQSESEYSQQQAEALKQQNEATARGQTFASKMQLPPGWGNMDERQRTAYLTTSYWNAVHANAPDVAKQILDLMTQSPLAYERFAQGDVATAKVDLVKAQTTFEQGLGALKVKLAGMADTNRIAVEAARLKGNAQIAGINARSREDIAQLAGAIRQRDNDDDNSVRQAIAVYQAQMKNYGIQLNPMTGLLEQAGGGTYAAPTAPGYQTVQPSPPIVQNFYGQGGQPQGGGGGGGGGATDYSGGGGGGGGASQHYDAPHLSSLVKDALSHQGVNKQAISNNLQKLVQSGQASGGDVFNVIKKNGLPPPQ